MQHSHVKRFLGHVRGVRLYVDHTSLHTGAVQADIFRRGNAAAVTMLLNVFISEEYGIVGC